MDEPGIDSRGGHRLSGVTGRNSEDSIYNIAWSDGHTSRYPFVWLRDNCRCHQCYQPSSYQRLVLMKYSDPEIRPTREEIIEDGNSLKVTWPDTHIGKYPSAWLRQQHFSKGNDESISDMMIRARPWGSERANDIPRFNYRKVLEDDEVLLSWLSALHEIGLTLLTDAPTSTGCLEVIGKRVAHLRQTSFGVSLSFLASWFYYQLHPQAVAGISADDERDTYQLLIKKNPASVGFTSLELGLHADLPYYYFTPGVQMLHCIRQTKTTGGGNEFADAYNAVLILKRDHPKTYELMKTVNINFRNCGSDDQDSYHYITTRPMIKEDSHGNFEQIHYNDPVRSSYMNVPVEEVQNVYRAMKLFTGILYEHSIVIKLKDGEIATFNNTRVMHGRIGFTADTTSSEVTRHYEGGYMDWDEINSRMRVLKEKRE